jgi:hypothetical protein
MKRFNLLVVSCLILVMGLFSAPADANHHLELPEWKTSYETLESKIGKAGYFDFRAYDKDGNLIWEELDRPNNLADEGEENSLDCWLRATSCPTQFYLRLFNDTPTETDALTDLTGEASGNGYAAQLVERSATGWPTLALDGGDFQATSSAETFSASGGSWGPVTYCVLATSTDGSGKLISYVALSQSRTLQDGETLQVTYKIKQQ